MAEKFGELPRESRPGHSHTSDFGEHKLDVYKLIHLAEKLDSEVVDISSLEHHKNDDCWHDENGNWIGPYTLIALAKQCDGDFHKMVEGQNKFMIKEIEKVEKADYEKYSLILIGNQLVDGMHRLTKAWIDGVGEIKIKRFEKLPEETIIVE